MSEATVLDLVRQMLLLVCEIAGPVIVGGLVLGIFVGVLQAAVQIQEQTLTFLPKLALAIGTVMLGGSWAIERMVTFTLNMMTQLAALGGQGMGA